MTMSECWKDELRELDEQIDMQCLDLAKLLEQKKEWLNGRLKS